MPGLMLGLWQETLTGGGSGILYIFTGGVWNNAGVWDDGANFWGP